MLTISNITKILEENQVKEWEVYVQKTVESEVHLRGNQIEAVRDNLENIGYTIRVLKKNSRGVGLGSASNVTITETGFNETVKTALKNAALTHLPIYNFPEPQKYPETKILDGEIMKKPIETLLDKAEQLKSTLTESSKVELTFCKLRAYKVYTNIYNSNNLNVQKKETFFYLELALKTGGGSKIAEYWPDKYYRRVRDFNVQESLEDWIQLTLDSLKAKTPPTGVMDVIFPPEIVAELLPPVIGYHASGQALYKKLSALREKQPVANENITIIDNGLHPYALNTSPFDDEGTPQRKTTIIERGVFENYIFDQLYSLLTGRRSTGNGLKASSTIEEKYNSQISNTVTNLEIKPGDWDVEEIIANVKKGILIRKFAWLNPDPITTSFGSEIRNGYLIVDGEVAGAVKGGQISGQVLDTGLSKTRESLLRDIFALSKQLTLEGNVIAPTIAARKLQVAGGNY
ncbi:MAG: TldD/PmbA family protein [Candidatus Odinarchaeum yellowstonii]|uniref:TldD/PmbA family protein n=1 Tax=Odinarchaeota yellowstonii (strain LCB_4) TaxID=1841599 RepID=A0AAF0IBF4_ODILC|nr:MAG: TldD/PmbA family protein [Candidatus Odinarchaeum yellowstonii]